MRQFLEQVWLPSKQGRVEVSTFDQYECFELVTNLLLGTALLGAGGGNWTGVELPSHAQGDGDESSPAAAEAREIPTPPSGTGGI